MKHIRFSLRMMLIVVALFSVLAAVYRVRLDFHRKQTDAERIGIQTQLDGLAVRHKRHVQELASTDRDVVLGAKVNLEMIEADFARLKKRLQDLDR
jgi:hypothetical protein